MLRLDAGVLLKLTETTCKHVSDDILDSVSWEDPRYLPGFIVEDRLGYVLHILHYLSCHDHV